MNGIRISRLDPVPSDWSAEQLAEFMENGLIPVTSLADTKTFKATLGLLMSQAKMGLISSESIAPKYDSTVTYPVNSYVVYEDVLYRCKENNTTGDWDASKWEAITATDIFQGATENASGKAGLVPVPSSAQRELFLKGDGTWDNPRPDLSSYVNNEDLGHIVAELYEEKTYNQGDYCIHDKRLYKCKANISQAEVWNANHWQEVKILDIISAMIEEIDIATNEEIDDMFVEAPKWPIFRFKLSSSPYDPDAGSSYTPTTGTDSVRGTWTNVSGSVWDCAVPDQTFFAEFRDKLTKGAYFHLIELKNADTLVSCSQLFAGCTQLISTCDLNIPNCYNVAYMFDGCTMLSEVGDISNGTLDTSFFGGGASAMFRNCTNLSEAPEVNINGASDTSYMFYGCTNLEKIPQYDLSTVQNMEGMFQGCSALGHYYSIPALDFSHATNCSYMFKDCSYLTLQTSSYNFNTSLCEDFHNMFEGASFKRTWTISTSKAIYCQEMFKNCGFTGSNSSYISVSLGRATQLYNMFEGCSFESVPIIYPDSTVATNCTEMFKNCAWCYGVTLYNWYVKLSGQRNPPAYHSSAFTGCCTQSGDPNASWYLNQIPSDWGGTGN